MTERMRRYYEKQAAGLCTACGNKNKSAVTMTRCADCRVKFSAYLQRRKNHFKQKRREWEKANWDKRLAASREENRRLRDAVLELYGAVCKCCGETMREFLTLDHVRGNGAEERATKIWNFTILRRLRNAGVINPDYQILCWNCNLAKHRYRVCPHQRII